MDCGGYQYHMDPTHTIDAKYKTGKYTMKPAALASDIVDFKDRPVPVSPALCMSKDLDGTSTPSYQSHGDLKPVKEQFFLYFLICQHVDQ